MGELDHPDFHLDRSGQRESEESWWRVAVIWLVAGAWLALAYLLMQDRGVLVIGSLFLGHIVIALAVALLLLVGASAYALLTGATSPARLVFWLEAVPLVLAMLVLLRYCSALKAPL